MAELFAAYPRALAHGWSWPTACHVFLDELRYEYPEELCRPAMT